MRRSAVVVVDPARELGQHGLGIAQLGPVDVVALEGMDEGLGEPVALRRVRRRRDRDEPQGMRVEDGGRRGVLRAIVPAESW